MTTKPKGAHGGARPGAGRKPNPRPHTALPSAISDPLEFLLAVMRDDSQTPARRERAARALLPYVHAKVGDGGGKKARAADDAKTADDGSHWGDLLRPRPPPGGRQ